MTLDSLYSCYANDVYQYLYSLCRQTHTAEDLLQDTFYKAFLHLEDNDISSVKAWLFKVAYYTFIDYQRKSKRVVLEEHMEAHISADSSTPETLYLQHEQSSELMHMLSLLSHEEMQVILLCDFHDLKLHEAADVLELNLNTLKSHLYRGRKKLKAMIIQKGESYD